MGDLIVGRGLVFRRFVWFFRYTGGSKPPPYRVNERFTKPIRREQSERLPPPSKETSEFGANGLDRPNSPTPFEKGVGSPKLIRQKHRLNASVFANKRSRCYATTDRQIRYCRICERRGSLSSFCSFRRLSLTFFFRRKKKKRK